MISNHVTCFILFYSIGWTSLFVGFFFYPVFLHFHPSCHWHPRMLSRLCDSVMELPHGLHWCIFSLILFMGGVLFVFWSAGRSLLPVPPPAVPSPQLGRARRCPRPASPGLTRACLDVLPVLPLRCAVFLCKALTVLSWAGETSRRASVV